MLFVSKSKLRLNNKTDNSQIYHRFFFMVKFYHFLDPKTRFLKNLVIYLPLL